MLRSVLLSACVLGLLSRSGATLPASPTPDEVVATGPAVQLAAGCDSSRPTSQPKIQKQPGLTLKRPLSAILHAQP
jgi:hypothetical protein